MKALPLEARRAIMAKPGKYRRDYIGIVTVYPLENCGVCGLAETAFHSCLFIVFKSGAHSFRPVVECIAERFMDSRQRITLGHEDLTDGSVRQSARDKLDIPSQRQLNMREGESLQK